MPNANPDGRRDPRRSSVRWAEYRLRLLEHREDCPQCLALARAARRIRRSLPLIHKGKKARK